MTESYYIGAYWRARKETSQVVARKLVDTLAYLQTCDTAFAHWFETGYSLEEARLTLVSLEYDAVVRMVSKGRGNDGTQEIEFSRLGFTISLWTGTDDLLASSLLISCGGFSPKLLNSFVLRLPRDEDTEARLLNVDKLSEILDHLISIWSPDYALVNSDHNMDGFKDKYPDAAQPIGWINYLGTKRIDDTDIAPLKLIYTPSGAALIAVTDELFQSTNVTHVALVEKLTRLTGQMRSIQVTEYRKVHISVVLHAGNSTLLERKPANAKFNQELLFNIQKQTGVDAPRPREQVIGTRFASIVFGSPLLCAGIALSPIMLMNLFRVIAEGQSGIFVVLFTGFVLISAIAAICGLLLVVPGLRSLLPGRSKVKDLYQDLMEAGEVVEGELVNVRSVEMDTSRGKQPATEIAYKYALPNGGIRHDSYTVFSDSQPESDRVKLWYIAVDEPDKA